MDRLSFLNLVAITLLLAGWPVPAVAGADDSGHFDPAKIPGVCAPCHLGHDTSGTRSLGRRGEDFCLACHSSGSQFGSSRASLGMSLAAAPADIAATLGKPYSHRGASCDDCHSVHGISAPERLDESEVPLGIKKRSPKRGFDDEAELCLSCHGSKAPRGADPHDLQQLFNPGNPSYHPVLAPGVGMDVPSLKGVLGTHSMINCTDCHTSDDPSGPRGPHASQFAGLLGAEYALQDGQEESASTYRLCYSCHDRRVVLHDDPFPLHALHVVEERTTCAMCHNSHGSTAARALIRFNEPTSLIGVGPSSSGRIEFYSAGPGSGTCFLTCHGVDHNPATYGGMFTSLSDPFAEPAPEVLGSETPLGFPPLSERPKPGRKKSIPPPR